MPLCHLHRGTGFPCQEYHKSLNLTHGILNHELKQIAVLKPKCVCMCAERGGCVGSDSASIGESLQDCAGGRRCSGKV